MAEKFVAKGTQLKISDMGGTPVFTAIPSAKNFDGPNMSSEEIDVTTHDSSGNYRETLPTFLDAGELSFDILFDPANAQHEALLDSFENKTLVDYKLIFQDTGNTEWDFSAFVKSFSPSNGLEDASSASVTLRINGAITR